MNKPILSLLFGILIVFSTVSATFQLMSMGCETVFSIHSDTNADNEQKEEKDDGELKNEFHSPIIESALHPLEWSIQKINRPPEYNFFIQEMYIKNSTPPPEPRLQYRNS